MKASCHHGVTSTLNMYVNCTFISSYHCPTQAQDSYMMTSDEEKSFKSLDLEVGQIVRWKYEIM